jgi:hypothetical protein
VPDTRPNESEPTPRTPVAAGAGGPDTAHPGSGTATAPAPAPSQAPDPRQAGTKASQPATGPAGWGPPTLAPLHGPWVSTSIWARRWPGPAQAATPATVIAVLVAAAVAAVSVPLDRTGVGWLITAVAGVAALVIARRAPERPAEGVPVPLVRRQSWPMPRLTVARYGWTAATVALLGVGTVRSAGWLFALCLLTAALTGTLAVAGGRSLRAMVAAVGMAPIAGLRALPWAARGLARIHRPAPGRTSGARIAATIAVSVALLAVFGGLFASADANFARILGRVLPEVNALTIIRWGFVGLVTAVVLLGAAFLRAAPPDLTGLESPGTTRVRRLEWAMPLGALVALFAAFVAVQLTALFGGTRHVLGTEGLTYADYARGGFWQLLVVTGLTLGVLAGAARWAPRETRTDRMLIRVLLGSLSALTLVIVASALHRMDLYADTYGLTRLRVLVALCEMWLGAAFVMVLIAGIRLRTAWLPRAVVAVGVLALLGLAGANPDGLIADRNVARFEQTGKIDPWYLSSLSADAVPALTRLTPPTRGCVLGQLNDALDDYPDDWRGWNYGREAARRALERLPSDEPLVNCPSPYGD